MLIVTDMIKIDIPTLIQIINEKMLNDDCRCMRDVIAEMYGIPRITLDCPESCAGCLAMLIHREVEK